jgi:hypothetical protein
LCSDIRAGDAPPAAERLATGREVALQFILYQRYIDRARIEAGTVNEAQAMSDETATGAILSGGCQCGRVRYAATGAPGDVSVCHCRMCQKAVGGPFATLAMFGPDRMRWIRGRPAVFRSSTIATRLFCADCGTPLAYVNDDTDKTEVTAGSFDTPEQIQPTRATGNERRLHWIGTLATLAAQTTDELYPARKKSSIVSFQHPDSDTPAAWTPPRGAPGREAM